MYEAIIEREAMASAGYSWEVGELPDGVIVEESSAANSPNMGASCIIKFTFKSKKKGTHQINLVYKRPWEKVAEDIQTVTVSFG